MKKHILYPMRALVRPDEVRLLVWVDEVYKLELEKAERKNNQSLWLKLFLGGLQRLKEDINCGEAISREKTRGYLHYQKLLDRCGLKITLRTLWVLWRGQDMRLIYTVLTEGAETSVKRCYVYVLDFIDHKTYNKIFGYK